MPSIFRTGQRIWLLVQGRRVTVRVQRLDKGSIVLNPGLGVVLDRGAVIPVGCPTARGFALYWMQVLTPPNAMGRQAVLRRNPNAGGNFNRRGWRVNVALAATIRRTGAPHFIDCHVTNLSMDGAFVVSGAGMSIGDVFDLRLSLPDSPPCELTARVFRTAPMEQVLATGAPTGESLCGAGMFFLEVPRETRSLLTRFLWKTIRDLHSASLRKPSG